MSRWARSPLPWLSALLALYLLAPIVAFVVRLGKGVPAAPGLGSALLTSLLTATISAALVTVLGTPLAYFIARSKRVAGRMLLASLSLPLALPPLMSGILLIYVVGPDTPIGRFFGGQLTDTRAGIVLAQTFVAAPFLIVAATAAFSAVDPAFEDVAASLGHGRLARFLRVAVPAALPGIGAGIMLTWLRAFGEFGATVILAYHPFGLPVFTFVQFDSTGLAATVAPIVAALGAALVVVLLVQAPLPRRRRSATAPFPSRPLRVQPPAPLSFELTKRLGDFSLQVAHRATSSRLALVGASGAGKSLTLRLLAGLTTPERTAHIEAGARTLTDLPPQRRGLGYVPQHPALMPRRTVWRQVTFGVGADPGLAASWLRRLGLTGLEDRYPHELSGGQQRRVALATQPEILLLDEPFTGLDAPVRYRLRRDLRRLQLETGLSTVIVTHDPEEAALLADEIVVLHDGRVLQAGTRESVFRAPRSPRVAELLGMPNALKAQIVAIGRLLSGGVEISAATGELSPGTEVSWSIRPERIELRPDGDYEGMLIDDVDLGSTRELTVLLGESLELALRVADDTPRMTGERLRIELPAQHIIVWPEDPDGPLAPIGDTRSSAEPALGLLPALGDTDASADPALAHRGALRR